MLSFVLQFPISSRFKTTLFKRGTLTVQRCGTSMSSMTNTTPISFHHFPSTAPHLGKWLDKSRQWDIEYDGFRSNHMSHVWIILGALHYPESSFQECQDLYTSAEADEAAHAGASLEPAREPTPTSPVITDDNWLDHISSIPEHYPSFLKYFDSKLTSSKSIPSVINKYLPTLLPGIAGAAFHTIIQTGWGVEGNHASTVAEGLAYMSTAFQPLSTPNRLWTSSKQDTTAAGPIDLALRFLTLAQKQDLDKKAHQASMLRRYQKLKRGGFQLRMMTFDDPELTLGHSLNSVGPLHLPKVEESLLPAVNECIALAAAASEGSRGEFFIIHGATALLGVLAAMKHLNPVHQRDALAYWWRAVMAALTVEGFPGLERTVEILEKWKKKGGLEVVTDDKGGYDGDMDAYEDVDEWWRKTIDKALKCYDEHVPKVAYVMWRWSKLPGLSKATRRLCKDVAERMVRDNQEGLMHKNIWIHEPPEELSYNQQGVMVGEGVEREVN